MRKRVYGQSKKEPCPFCDRIALTTNPEGIPTCEGHKEKHLNPVCACGKTLEVLHGKYGVFFNCSHCGNLTLRKVLVIQSLHK